MAALEGGNCVGTVFDTTYFAGLAGEPKWADYAMVLSAIDPEPWGMGVRKEDTKFAQYVSDVSKEWHKTGFILDLEKKWGIPQSPFLLEQQSKAK
jgi:polar amino acid transport system substrate-binding protein